jgi:hypothetical protein
VSEGVEENLTYQVSWQTLPGLRGLSCSNFTAVATPAPDRERGVAVECASENECVDLVRRLEAHFAAQRFSNNAAAFESVKAYVLEWTTRK